MLIGLDGLPLTLPRTGVGHYTYELARALASLDPDVDVEIIYPSTYPFIELRVNDGPLPSNLKLNRVQVGTFGRHWWTVGLPRYLRSRRDGGRLDIFHGTNYEIPLWRRCATVLTIHDLSHLLYPQTHERRSVKRAHRRLPIMARTAEAIITPTETVRGEVIEHLNVSPNQVFAIPEAARTCFRPLDFADTAEVRDRLGIGNDFLLAVGTLEPRKNLSILVDAFNKLSGEQLNSDTQLVIAGGRGWLSGPIYEAIEKSPARKRIVVTDYLHDDDLRALYSSCRAFIYPSIYEGFGLPPLEAMGCGAPVIASRIPTLLETLEDAASFFDPASSGQLAQAIVEVTSDDEVRRRLMADGQRQAAKFSWERTAQLTFEVYRGALDKFR